MKYLILIAIFSLTLFATDITKKDPIERIDLDNGNTVLKIHFNYLNAMETIKRIKGSNGSYSINFPLPNKWEIIKAKGHIKYTSSILMLPNLSAAVISFNDIVLTQFKLKDLKTTGILFDIEPEIFSMHNVLKFEAIQHYTNECEDEAHSSLWTDINIEHSYIELLVRPRPIKEQISSISHDVFDDKQYSVTPLNYILDNNDDAELKNFALFSSIASNNLKYRLERIKVSNQGDKENHNIIITTKHKAKKLLFNLQDKYIIDERPSLSMFFNAKTCNTWINEHNFATIVPGKIKTVTAKDGAFYGKSLYLNRSKITLQDIKLKDKKATSIAFWFKPENIEKSILFGFESSSLMIFNGHIGFNTANKDLYGAKYRLKKGKWYHMVATFNNGHINRNSIIINGRSLHLKQLVGNSLNNNANFSKNAYIGSFGEHDNLNYHGYIDQFYMFDHAISSKNAKKIYDYSLNHKDTRVSEDLFIDDKLAHDINVIQNPYHIDKAIIVIAPEDSSKIDDCIHALYKTDLSKYKRQGLNINSVTIPEPAKAYSAKHFLPLNQKIYFKELGFKTTFLKGWYPPKINLKFKSYPDNHFDRKDKIDMYLHYIFPTTINDDSVVNIYMNNIFSNQLNILDSALESNTDIFSNKMFDFSSATRIPSYLLGKGSNTLRLDFSLVPLKKGYCEVYNLENLVASVLDDSYFILPKAKNWIELPYMEYIVDAQYPYSIYPDMQDTVLFLANENYDTVASAMNFIFFLTQEIGSHPNYIRITRELTEKDKEKNIIVFGTIYDFEIQKLSKNAPIVFDADVMKKDYPYIQRYIEHHDILNHDRLKKYNFLTSMKEVNLVDTSMIMQMSKSPYNSKKTVLSFSANSPRCLDSAVRSIFKYENRNNILGDLVIYDYEDETGVAYNIKDKYILSNMNWLETLSLHISSHPLRYLLIFIILLLIFVWIVRKLLQKFKEEHHKNVE